MSRRFILISVTVFLGLVGLLGVSAPGTYQEISVEGGGTITGKVTMKGAVPVPRVFPLILYPFGPFCKKISDGQGNVRLTEFAVDSSGGLRDAIVAVEQVKKGKPFVPIKNDFVTVDCM